MELPLISKSAYGSSARLDMGAMGHALMPAEKQARVELAANIAPGGFAAIPQQRKVHDMRIVRVYIADTNANIPLDKRVIYTSTEKLTDLTDQELFFDANPAALLEKHNALRSQTIDKAMTAARGKEVFLEPARIRDLKMVVVDIAAF